MLAIEGGMALTSRHLMQQYDATCKRVLSNKYVLANILKGCTSEFADYSIQDIASKYIEGQPSVAETAVNGDSIIGISQEDKQPDEGVVTFDVRFLACAPGLQGSISLIINVEAQNKFKTGYPLVKRAEYYCSRMISSQYGTVFTKSHYEKICKVYSIWVCPHPGAGWRNTITQYKMSEVNLFGDAHEAEANYDLMSVIIIGLGPRRKKERSTRPVIDMLRTLLLDKITSEQRKAKLNDDYSVPCSAEFDAEVERVCNLSEGIYDDGKKAGIAEGKKLGIAEGKLEQAIYSVRGLMHNMKLSADEAMDNLGYQPELREKIRQALA